MLSVFLRSVALCVSVFVASAAAAGPLSMGNLPSVSGLAPLEGAVYVVVHDVKTTGTADDPGVRVSLLDLAKPEEARAAALPVDWTSLAGELPNDLEAVCALPGHANEFLIVESSYKQGKFGRIIRLQLEKSDGAWSGKAVHAQHFPALIPGTQDELDNIEGGVAFSAGSRTVLVLGKRGNNEKDAILFTGDYDRDATDFVPASVQRYATPFRDRPILEDKRYCGELLIDGERLLATSCQDTGNDDGPFESALYQIGAVSPAAAVPVSIEVRNEAIFEFPGRKVEALALSADPRWRYVAATDDENFGGSLFWVPGAGSGK